MALDDWWVKRLLRNFVRTSKLEPNNKDKLSVLYTTFVKSEGYQTATFTRMAMMVNFSDSDGNYRGAKSTTYFTIRPELLFKNITPAVTLYNPKTMREVGEALILKYGLPIKSDAFPVTPIDASVLPATIDISMGSYGWMEPEFIPVRITRAKVSVQELFQNTVLDSPQIPTTLLTGRTPAEYTYALDFTPDLPEDYTALLNYPTMFFDETVKDAVMADQAVIWLMGAIAKRMAVPSDWEVVNPDGFAMFKSQLVYNGLSKDYVPANAQPWSPRGDTGFENLLVIQFSSDIPGRAGLGFFHYNTLGRY